MGIKVLTLRKEQRMRESKNSELRTVFEPKK
jgi:hypothetical protein